MRLHLLPTLLLFTAALPAQQPAARPTSLPVTRIALYKNGVGYFEHTGSITGNAQVNLDFTSGQLNDVLQSLTAIDLNGGRIAGAGYNSTTPLEQQLKNLSLDLTADRSDVDFYTAVRGARVQVTGSGPAFTGRLLSIDLRDISPKPASDTEATPTHRFITVVSDTGTVRTLELTAAVSVTLLDTALHTDITRYLELIANNRNEGLRHLTLTDNGTGTRELHLSYISEVPIWKSTYRILFTDAKSNTSTQTATLQGWSVVDNTTGIDWVNVHLSLIAGAPQSFIQPLSQPIYSNRPEVPIAQDAQLTPQTYESGLSDAPPPPAKAMAEPTIVARRAYAVGSGQGVGMAGGSPGGVYGGITGPAAGGALNSITTADYEDLAANSITPTATSAAFDDFFAYNITEPITIRKNESALVPILQAKVSAERVTLVSSDGSSVRQPLRALWLTNTSGLTLDRGSFTLIENGSFGGEGLLDPIHPAEKRLLSYAADQAVHVTVEGGGPSTDTIDRISASKGVLQFHKAQTVTTTYTLHNAAPDARTIVLEHPVRPGYTLTSATKPDETTATVDRFRLQAAPGETLKLALTARHRSVTTYQLTRADDAQLVLILKQSNDDPQLTAALQPVLEARRRVADAQTAVDQTNDRLKSLRSDEDRQRANITALASADKSSRDRFVHDLNATEDAIASAQTELTTRTSALDAAKADLANRIESLQLDEKP